MLPEFFLGQREGVRQLDSHLLLLLEDEFVVLHVLLRVRLQVASQLVEVEALFVRAALPAQEELAELGGPEGGADQPLVVHVLVDRLQE